MISGFRPYSNTSEGLVKNLNLTHVLPSDSDIAALKANYSCHITKVAQKIIPEFSLLTTTDIGPEYPDIIQKKNGFIPLPGHPSHE
jgi:hypothetical protein